MQQTRLVTLQTPTAGNRLEAPIRQVAARMVVVDNHSMIYFENADTGLIIDSPTGTPEQLAAMTDEEIESYCHAWISWTGAPMPLPAACQVHGLNGD